MKHATSSPKNLRTRYRRAVRHLEILEPRTLLSANLSTYVVANASPAATVYDSSGSLWVYDMNGAYYPSLERIKNGAVDSAANSVIPMDNSVYSPYSFAGGPNGHIYATDWSSGSVQGIDDIDPSTGTITKIEIDTPGVPTSITVTDDGTVWFTLMNSSTSSQNENVIGCMNPVTHAITTYKLDDSLSDSQLGGIVANGSNSVWIALGALDYRNDSGPVYGTTRVATASVVNGKLNITAYTMTTGTDADADGNLTGIVSDGQGGVWFALSNEVNNWRPGVSKDAIVHGTFDAQGHFTETAYVASGTTVDVPRTYSWLTTDNSGDVWFISPGTEQIGSFDGTNFTFIDDPTPTCQLSKISSNEDGSQFTILTSPTVYDDSGMPVGGSPLIQVDFAAAPITFQGETYNLNIKEDTAISSTLLATFTAPSPASAYQATITWGDGTTTKVTPTLVGDNTYAIVVSGKSFATQGSYAGSIAIKDGSVALGSLSFTSTVGDIPLNVTSFNVTPLLLRIAAATATFTDDADLSVSTWTATIKWGDNTSSTGLIVRDPTQSGRYLVIALHQYKSKGTYTARLTVTTTETGAAILNSTLTTTVTVR